MDRRTFTPKTADIKREWFVVDAAGMTLGRLATVVASTLRGKAKPYYAPHLDTGDFVIVVNAEKIEVTGKKETQKIYYRHSGYPGGLRGVPLREMRATFPDRILKEAVKGMLPRTQLGEEQIKKLKVYAGPEHPHVAQQPRQLAFASGGNTKNG